MNEGGVKKFGHIGSYVLCEDLMHMCEWMFELRLYFVSRDWRTAERVYISMNFCGRNDQDGDLIKLITLQDTVITNVWLSSFCLSLSFRIIIGAIVL